MTKKIYPIINDEMIEISQDVNLALVEWKIEGSEKFRGVFFLTETDDEYRTSYELEIPMHLAKAMAEFILRRAKEEGY